MKDYSLKDQYYYNYQTKQFKSELLTKNKKRSGVELALAVFGLKHTNAELERRIALEKMQLGIGLKKDK
jgi:hypothetical protein